MGTWGTAIYSDDLAADLRQDLRDLIGQGVSVTEAVDRLSREYSSAIGDPDEGPVFWLAIADVAWTLGRPHRNATAEALRIIEQGVDLQRWDDPTTRRKREVVLQKLAAKLKSPAPSPRRVAKPFIATNEWEVGELIGYRLASGSWTLFRVIGHHQDKGGRHAICELLDWVGPNCPGERDFTTPLGVRTSAGARNVAQFMLGEPRRKQDLSRIARTGARSAPSQRPGGFSVFVFPHVDRLLQEMFDLA